MRKSKYKSYSVPSKAGFRVAFSFYILHGVVPFALVSSEEKIQEDYEAYLREKYGDDYDEDEGEEEDQGWGQSM